MVGGNDSHLDAVGKPGGLFVDDRITNTPWAGKIRRTRMVIYRYVNVNDTDTILQLNNVCEKIESAFSMANLTVV